MMKLLLLLSLYEVLVVRCPRAVSERVNGSHAPYGKFDKNKHEKIFSGFSLSKVKTASESGGLMVDCGEKSWRIVVTREYFKPGLSFSPRLVRLGEHGDSPEKQCSPHSDFLTDSQMVITAGLQDCGSESWVSDDWLIYSNKLVFSTGPVLLTLDNVQTVRGTQTVVPIECHYKRRLRVSAEPLSPTWLPMTSTAEAAGLLHFSLHVIEYAPGFRHQSSDFLQGEPLLLEAAVYSPMHSSLRIYVDHCVVTADPDPFSKPSFEFISNHGCLVDSVLPYSLSKFYNRTNRNALRFSFEAFISPQDKRKQVFISCHMRAASHYSPSDSQNKACYFHWPSFSWHSVDGNNTVCSCCETGDCAAGKTDIFSKYLEVLTTVDAGSLHALPTKSVRTGKLVMGTDVSLDV